MDTIRTNFLKNSKRVIQSKVSRKSKPPNKGQEKRCVDNFRDLGISEVATPLGYIDLLTPSYLIEFKIYTNAKDALGQVLCYSHFVLSFPTPGPRKLLIVLFGKGLSTWKGYPLFERICSSYNVEVFKLSNNSVYQILKEKIK